MSGTSNSAQHIRSLRDRFVTLYGQQDETTADLQELRLEGKSAGLNVREIEKWAKAEHKDKAGKLRDALVDAHLYGAALGHDTGLEVLDHSKSKTEVGIDRNGSKKEAA